MTGAGAGAGVDELHWSQVLAPSAAAVVRRAAQASSEAAKDFMLELCVELVTMPLLGLVLLTMVMSVENEGRKGRSSGTSETIDTTQASLKQEEKDAWDI